MREKNINMLIEKIRGVCIYAQTFCHVIEELDISIRPRVFELRKLTVNNM